MKIPFQLIQSLLSSKLIVQSLNEYISQNYSEINPSLTVAELIEDYKYLSVMNISNPAYNNFVIITNPTSNLNPIVIERADMSLDGLAKLYFELRNIFKLEDFLQLLEKECVRQDLNPESVFYQFEKVNLQRVIDQFRLYSGNVERNDLCPCGSNKKYKYCHGSAINSLDEKA